VQYANIYMRGALTAGLLDIRLLELSGGQRGLQDLIVDLTHRFGKRRAFPESTFVDTLAGMTSPEIRDFFNRYVWDSQRLPIADYYGKLGIRLLEAPDGTPERFAIDPAPTPAQKLLRDAWLGRRPRPAS
jgi:predicted metalloprotease with PDZ domain